MWWDREFNFYQTTGGKLSTVKLQSLSPFSWQSICQGIVKTTLQRASLKGDKHCPCLCLKITEMCECPNALSRHPLPLFWLSPNPRLKKVTDKINSNLSVACILTCHATAVFENGTHVILAAASCTFWVQSSDNVRKMSQISVVCRKTTNVSERMRERNHCWLQNASF